MYTIHKHTPHVKPLTITNLQNIHTNLLVFMGSVVAFSCLFSVLHYSHSLALEAFTYLARVPRSSVMIQSSLIYISLTSTSLKELSTINSNLASTSLSNVLTTTTHSETAEKMSIYAIPRV